MANKAQPRSPEGLPQTDPATAPAEPTESESIITPELQRVMREEVAEITSIQVAPEKRTQKDNAFVAELLEKTGTALRKNQDEQRRLEAKREQVTEQLAKLDELWHAGQGRVGTMSRHKYQGERKKALQMQQELHAQLAQMYTRNALLRSGWLSDMVGGKVSRDAFEDYAVIDPVIRCYPELEGARVTVKQQRTEQKQTLFRKRLMARYDAVGSDGFVFCQISHSAEVLVTAAHIVDVNVGFKTAEALFGEREDHIWSERNGLVIQKAYERLLDDAKAVILPVSTRPDETEFEFVLLTTDLTKDPTMPPARVWSYDELHRRRLQFRTAARPAKRYLYFKAAVSLLRRRRACVEGHEGDLEMLAEVGRSMWASPKPYLKNSVLYRFSRELGGLSQQEANRFWGVEDNRLLESLSLEDRKTADEVAVLATHAALGGGEAAPGKGEASAAGRGEASAAGGSKSKGKGKAAWGAGEWDDDPFV